MAKNVDKFVAKMASTVGELEAVKEAKKTFEKLAAVANDVEAIKATVQDCAKVPHMITLDAYAGWKEVTSGKL